MLSLMIVGCLVLFVCLLVCFGGLFVCLFVSAVCLFVCLFFGGLLSVCFCMSPSPHEVLGASEPLSLFVCLLACLFLSLLACFFVCLFVAHEPLFLHVFLRISRGFVGKLPLSFLLCPLFCLFSCFC